MLVKKDYYLHERDTGSTALQIISLREKINRLKIHLKENKKNVPAIRALLKNVAWEKRFFKYLRKHDPNVYESLKKDLK